MTKQLRHFSNPCHSSLRPNRKKSAEHSQASGHSQAGAHSQGDSHRSGKYGRSGEHRRDAENKPAVATRTSRTTTAWIEGVSVSDLSGARELAPFLRLNGGPDENT